MERKKVCPLLMTGIYGNSGDIIPAQVPGESAAQMVRGVCACLGPACEWYDAAAERCAVLTLARGTR